MEHGADFGPGVGGDGRALGARALHFAADDVRNLQFESAQVHSAESATQALAQDFGARRRVAETGQPPVDVVGGYNFDVDGSRTQIGSKAAWAYS